ncbi:MAG: hypothetical protein ABIV10_02700 [Gemmatimonadaceae bacterium]
MNEPSVWTGKRPSATLRAVASGTVAAAAVLGLLIGIGGRAGTRWRPVNAAAHAAMGAQADGVWSYHGSVTPVGGLVVLVLSIAAGFAVTRIATWIPSMHVSVVAAIVAFTGYLLHVGVAARMPGGLSSLLAVGELRGLYVMLGLALIGGMRFAFAAADEGSDGGRAAHDA